MLKTIDRRAVRRRIRHRIRRRIRGTSDRPRLAVFRSSRHIYVQAIDDTQGRTLASASTVDDEVRGKVKSGSNVAAAKIVGEVLAVRLKKAGLERVVFDRGGHLFHGRLRALADALRESGLKM